LTTDLQDSAVLLSPVEPPATQVEPVVAAPKKPWKVWLKRVLILSVLVAVGWQFTKLYNDWSDQSESIWQRGVSWSWVGASTAAFMVGQIFFALHWRQILIGGKYHAPLFSTVRAYCVGTLGKYIPGKAFVLVLRTGLMPQSQGRRFEIGMAVTYETFAAMGGAGALGAVAFFLFPAPLPIYTMTALGIAVGLHVAMLPRVFEKLSKLVSVPFGQKGKVVSVAGWHPTALRWSPLLLLAWMGSGLSLWALTQALAMQPLNGSATDPMNVLFIVGTASFGTAAGFLILFLPAGLGAREGLLAALLTFCFGESADILIVVLILRTVWTLGEVALAGIFYLMPGIGWAGAVAARRLAAGADN